MVPSCLSQRVRRTDGEGREELSYDYVGRLSKMMQQTTQLAPAVVAVRRQKKKKKKLEPTAAECRGKVP